MRYTDAYACGNADEDADANADRNTLSVAVV